MPVQRPSHFNRFERTPFVQVHIIQRVSFSIAVERFWRHYRASIGWSAWDILDRCYPHNRFHPWAGAPRARVPGRGGSLLRHPQHRDVLRRAVAPAGVRYSPIATSPTHEVVLQDRLVSLAERVVTGSAESSAAIDGRVRYIPTSRHQRCCGTVGPELSVQGVACSTLAVKKGTHLSRVYHQPASARCHVQYPTHAIAHVVTPATPRMRTVA